MVEKKSEYTIGAGDVLSIKVYDHEELTVKVRVSEGGTIEFPLIGQVHVGGQGVSTAAERIESALADGYIIEPQVTIFIEQFKSKKVVVLGPVHTPGLVELNGPITLLELISQVGGLKENAGQTAMIKRQKNGGIQENIPVDLDRLIRKGDSRQNILVQGGDTVTIAEGAVCFITGEVNQPGEYPCGRNASVLKIISLAGSFTEKALESGIKISRTINGVKQVVQHVNQDTLVQPDDVIIVPERTISKEDEKLCYITGEVKRPGAYPCSGNTTVLKLLTRAGGLTDKALESGIEINRQINGSKQVLKGVNQDTILLPDDVVLVPASFATKEAVCYITGQVNRPGAYPCSGNTSILKLLTRAGGFTDKALESGIQINRQMNGRKQILQNVNQDTVLRPDDVVVVPASAAKKEAVCYITGQVNKPGAYPCGRKTTVLKMISLAGSFTGIAAESSIKINRMVNGAMQELDDVELDTLVQPEDVIVVPESFF
ncbi:MAG: SLBB domain-containing protein [Candidatus Electrothrix aestuarii]|uniref:SLBB domain-containing protein n=1 Tax=Candidatus Electrothrix aestuarii TaxID=3062594 RepID=A0AAU8LRB9_9BACT|nr:SLBB domain-containing protein [Candidatus Electrothrix aestuarii]